MRRGFLALFLRSIPLRTECREEGVRGRIDWETPLKEMVFVGWFTFLSLLLFVTPLMAGYSNKEAREHFENGLNYIGKGYIDLAVKEIEEAVRLEPRVIDGHRHLATAYSLHMEINKAIGEYEVMFQIDPTLVEVPPLKANWLEENEGILRRFDVALKQLHERRAHSPMVHVLLSWLYGQGGKLRKAHEELLHIQEKDRFENAEHLTSENRVIASLMLEFVEALQNSPRLAKTELDLLLFTLNR
jgi:tetratricopeptide (TPR) repeat protein